MEIEAKYRLTEPTSPEQIEALDWRPFRLGVRAETRQRDTLWDTESRELSSSRHAVRLRQGGKQPGKDVKIVSIDGTKAVVQAIADGRAQADIESNPRFGALSFKALDNWFAGKPVAQKQTMKDMLYNSGNAAEAVKSGAPY